LSVYLLYPIFTTRCGKGLPVQQTLLLGMLNLEDYGATIRLNAGN